VNVIVSRAHKALVVPDMPGTRAVLPDACELPPGKLVVRHGMRETLLLRHLGMKVPNPFLLYYDWCGGKPFRVQRATVKLLTEHPRAYVLNHMGTGKTKCALWAWDALNRAGLTRKLLVVAPLSTLSFVWAREVFATLPGRKVQVLHGTRQDRLDRLAVDADIYVINHDGLKVVADELYTRPDITCLVLDELAVYRNNNERSKLMRKFAKKFPIVWGLTGAPMPNEVVDVWGQARIITPHTVPERRGLCKDMLMTRVSNYVWKAKPDAIEKAFKMLQPSVRFALDDVVELPSTVTRSIDVALSSEQDIAYKGISADMAALVKQNKIVAVNAGAMISKLLQIAGGWVYTAAPHFIRLDASPRIGAMIDLINSAEKKVIVYVPFRHALEGVEQIFTRLKVGFDYCTVHGDTPKRETIFNLFQNTAKYKVMLAHPGCVHHGLTLTAADTIIWYLPITSLDTYLQANARIRRVGQKHRQQVIHLQGTPVEKKIYKLLKNKEHVQDQLLAMLEDHTSKLNGGEDGP